MTTTTDTLAILKLLVKGRPPSFVAMATDQNETFVEALATQHGWPDRQKLADAIAVLEIDATTAAIPTREEPPPIPAGLTTPAVRRGDGPRSTVHRPSTGDVSKQVSKELASGPPPLTVDEIVRACRRSESKRIQALGTKLAEAADKATTALRAEREVAEAKLKKAEEFAAKKAAVDKLAAQLAKAKAELSALKPSGVTEAALDFACEQCGDVFGTSSGRKRHVTRKHTPSSQESTA